MSNNPKSKAIQRNVFHLILLKHENQSRVGRTYSRAQHLLATFVLLRSNGDVDVYVEPDEDGFEVPHEECFLHLR